MTDTVANSKPAEKKYHSTRNACKLCTPLGACVAFKGVKGCVPLLHGSQGCATYIRRYMISHYREPVDIASSNFSEETTIFGGHHNFNTGVDNIIHQYNPEVIAIASTCLSETIGEDVEMLIKEYTAIHNQTQTPHFVYASTPSYTGTHIDGFLEAVFALVKQFSKKNQVEKHINLFPGFLSPEDLRQLKQLLHDFEIDFIMLPDYSISLDNPNWSEYNRIPEGGTPVELIEKMADAFLSVQFGSAFNRGFTNTSTKKVMKQTAAEYLENKFYIPAYTQAFPIGIKQTDLFFKALEQLSGNKTPEKYSYQRGQLIDAYIDGHKYLFGTKAILYGEEDLVIPMIEFLKEIGIDVVLAASGGESGFLKQHIDMLNNKNDNQIISGEGMDFEEISELASNLKPDLIIGNSKGYYISRRLNIPLVRIGFPVHDRIGAQRIKHILYNGTQELFDRITNTIIEYKQDSSEVGYKYM